MNSVVASLVVFLAFASLYANAYDPGILQDFCVAINDTNSAVFVNGKFCKDPSLATAEDFFFAGLNIPRSVSNDLGVKVTPLTVNEAPGLNTLGVSLGHIDYDPHGLNPPHHHPRASEILLVLEGTLYAGFVTSNPDHRLFTKILKPGDVFIFPLGLVHFQLNIANTNAIAIVAFSSQNPGFITEANTLFGAQPAIHPDVLTKAFHLDKNLVKKLQKQTWSDPTL